jgi:hypothetical protein
MDVDDLMLGAAFDALLILGALSVAFVLTATLAGQRVRVSAPRTPTPAEQKALMLLKERLSPCQRARFESYGHFEVIGSRTSKRYRIRGNRVVNIDDERGVLVVTWCFGPERSLPMGDIMLAQKIALENDEEAALAIASGIGRKELPPAGSDYRGGFAALGLAT